MPLLTVGIGTLACAGAVAALAAAAAGGAALRKDAGGGGGSGPLDPRFVWVCSVCTYNYVKTREESISTCPRCGSYNRK